MFKSYLSKFYFSSIVIDGNHLAKGIVTTIQSQIRYQMQCNPYVLPPRLAILLVGRNSASESYVSKKINLCNKYGIKHELYRFPQFTNQASIISKIHQLNARYDVDGILVQLPLPDQLSKNQILSQIKRSKDVDQLNLTNYQHLLKNNESQIMPCTPAGILYILDSFNINLSGLKTTVVGRSNLVGFPLAMALIKRQAHVTICHKYTPNLEGNIRKADLIISAVGKRHLIKGEWIKNGAVVIDVGINKGLPQDKKNLVGDVEFEIAKEKASLITPVPGGVGPLTVAMLMQNVFELWCNNKGLQKNVEESENEDDYFVSM